MKIINIKNDDSKVTFEIEIDSASWKKTQNDTMNLMIKNFSIPGFRKGFVPVEMAKSKIDQTSLMQNSINKIIPKIVDFVKASKEFEDSKALDAILNQRIKTISKDNFSMFIDFEAIPEIKNFKIDDLAFEPYEKEELDDKKIDLEIKSLLKKDAMIVAKKSDVVENNDMVTINFEGFINDKTFEGGKAEKYDLEIGSKSFIDNFEEQLIGHKKGDKNINVNVTFPKDYHNSDYASKKAKFVVDILDIKTIQYPDINEKYLKGIGLSKLKNESDLRNYLKELIENEMYFKYTEKCNQILSDLILKNASIGSYPKSLLDMYQEQLLKHYESEAKNNHMNLDQYLESLNVSKNAFNDILQKNSQKNLLVALTLEKLIKDFDIVVEDNDIKQYLSKMTKYFNDEDKAKTAYEQSKDYCDAIILKDKLIEILIKKYTKKSIPISKSSPKK